jgi:excisionase family DNA binding protein
MQANSPQRFLALTEVAEVLNISVSQAYALVRRGDLSAIKIGGRGQWRVEATELETYIEEAYRSTRQFITDHPFIGDESLEPDPVTTQPEPQGAD